MSVLAALPFESNVPAEYMGVTRAQFLAKVRVVAAQLTIPAEWLMVVMFRESELKPWAKSPYSTATGLIQWLDSTARSTHGVSAVQIGKMNGVQQLDLVLVYFKPNVKKIKTLLDTYLTVHYPVGVNKGATYVLYAKGSAAYAANSGLDLTKDGTVTVAEVGSWLVRGTGLDPFALKSPGGAITEIKKKDLIDGSSLVAILALCVLGAVAYFIYSGRWGQVWAYTKLRTKQLIPL